jgi:hypothetical protein
MVCYLSYLTASFPIAKSPANANANVVGAAPHLVTLAPEIHLLLIDILDPVSSTCLGLTCKVFYNLHRARHGTVPLHAPDDGREISWLPIGCPARLHF